MEDRTVDAFHRGDFFLVQPRGRGHRAGMDAMMLAAAVPSSFSGRLADFGAGAGAAGLAVASRCSRAKVALIELSPDMTEYALLSLAHAGNAHLAQRASVIEADVTLTGKRRQAAGLTDASFDFVIMNPPFNPGIDRPSPDPLKREAHVMVGDGSFEGWLRTAAAVVRPGGGLAIIARPDSLAPILEALKGRFGGTAILPIHPRAETPAIRVVLRAVRGSRAGLALHPPLVLHEDGERFSAKADAINNGKASLFGD
jgi:tRNA1(Val) A37 N6-methylase TrmN6